MLPVSWKQVVWRIPLLLWLCMGYGQVGWACLQVREIPTLEPLEVNEPKVNQKTPSGKFPPTVCREFSTTWDLEGLVVDEQGKAVPNATLSNRQLQAFNPMGFEYGVWQGDQAQSDSRGRFQLKIHDRCYMIVDAKGYAPQLIFSPSGSYMDVTLHRGREIRGTVFGLDGQPEAGAIVTPVNWLVPTHGPRKEMPLGDLYATRCDYAVFLEKGRKRAVTTDEQGMFVLPNMPRKHRVALVIAPKHAAMETVFVRSEDDHEGVDFFKQTLVDNDFEYVANKGPLLKIKAVDESGKPQKIGRVSLIPAASSYEAFSMRRKVAVNALEAVVPLPSKNVYGLPSHVYVQPDPSADLLGARFEIPAVKESDVLEREVVFSKGHVVSGRVVGGEKQAPLSGVSIHWAPLHAPFERQVEGKIPSQLQPQTNRNGEFRFVIPWDECSIGIASHVDGYIGLNGGELEYSWLRETAPQVAEKMFRELSLVQIEEAEPLTFVLDPSIDGTIRVVDGSNSPVADAVVVVARQGGVRLVRYGNEQAPSYPHLSVAYRSESTVLSTNANGEVQVEDLFFDALTLYLAQKSLQQDKGVLSFLKRWNLPALRGVSMYVFSVDGLNNGGGKTPVPEPGEKQVEATIRLSPGGTVYGRVVNRSGQPVSDLTLSTRLQGWANHVSVGQAWSTQTRDDGWFRLEGLPIGQKFRWEFPHERVVVKFDLRELGDVTLASGRPTVIGSLPVEDYAALLAPLPELDLVGLKDAAALAELRGFLEQQKQRIGRLVTEGVGSELAPPVVQFRNRMSSILTQHVKALANRKPGSDFDFEVLKLASEQVDQVWRLGYSSYETSDLGEFCLDRLIQHHAQRPEAQPWLIKLTNASSYQDSYETWARILERPVAATTKLAGVAWMLNVDTHMVRTSSSQSRPIEEFEEVCDKLDKNLTRLKELIAATSQQPNRATLAPLRQWAEGIQGWVDHLDKQPERASLIRLDVKRLEQLKRLLKRHSEVFQRLSD